MRLPSIAELKGLFNPDEKKEGKQTIYEGGTVFDSLYETVSEAKQLIQNIHYSPDNFYQRANKGLKIDLDFTADKKTRERAIAGIPVAVTFGKKGIGNKGREEFLIAEAERLAPVVAKRSQQAIWLGMSPNIIIPERRNDLNFIADLLPQPRRHFGFLEGKVCMIENEFNPWRSRKPLTGVGNPLDVADQQFYLHCPTFQFDDAERDEEYYGGLAKYILVTQALQGFVEMNYVSFSEMYGKPIRYGTVNASIGEKEKQELRRGLRDLGSMLSGIFPEGAEVKILELADKGGSVQLYKDLITMFKQNKTKLVLGTVEMTTPQANGSRAKVETLDRIRQDVLYEDLERANASLTELIQKSAVMNFFPDMHWSQIDLQAKYVWEPPKDLVQLATIVSMLSKNPAAARQIPVGIMNEDFGIRKPDEGEETFGSGATDTTGLDIFNRQ